jgi:DNA-binding CsgD family transcriptional regulator/tetratricopeptide (TPR) repeat protein
MEQVLLERDDTLAALIGAVEDAAAGHGSVVLVSGGAGIGKTSVVRAFARAAAGRARVLLASCDDLMAPRTLGPLRDAALESSGPLAAAFADDRPADGVFTAVMAELAAAPPTALVVEDVHWADDATIDVLGYVARRIEPLPAVLVLSFRDDELGPSHPLQRMLGALAGRPVRRLALPPLSRTAVRRLAASTGADADALHRVTGGNPFFVTEALASPADAVPATVVEAVLARVRRLDAECRGALEQLSVVPSRIRFELAGALLGDRIDALAEAELAGVLEVSAHHLGFRHELARRAIERSLPALARRRLNARVLHALQQEQRPERASLMHFAVEAGDVETVLAVGPDAAREAARDGSHRQALAHLESVRPHLPRLGERERAAVLDDYGWELYNAHRFREAVDAGRAAAALYEELGDPVAAAHCLVRVSRHLFMAGETVEAEECADRAVTILEPAGDTAALASASLQNGAILALTEEFERAAGKLELARRLAQRAGRGDLAALALNYLGVAAVERGDPGGLRRVRDSLEVALGAGDHEIAARGYCNVAELLYREGRLGELEACIAEGLPFARERGFWSHAYNLELHRCVLQLRRGDLDGALAGLRALVHGVEDPGMLFAYSVPWLGRALARRGDPAAGGLLAGTWDGAQRQRLLPGVAYAGLASVEWAWLAGRPEIAERVAASLAPRLAHPGAAPFRAELARYLARAGLPAEPFDGCPEPWAAGLRGDWRAAADGWAGARDPYEQALELTESGDQPTVAEGLRILDAMDAAGAAARARATLRAAGMPAGRGPRATTRANPFGLTERQLDVLELLSEDLTNAQIAERLVLSVRTVDHHVAAVLEKLGVPSRHEAAGAAREHGVGPPAATRR